MADYRSSGSGSDENMQTARLWQACDHPAAALTDPQIEQLRTSFEVAW